MRSPTWLDKLGREFWHEHYKLCRPKPVNLKVFALMCDAYSRYRNATNERFVKSYLECFLRLAKVFGLLPTHRKSVAEETEDEMLAKYLRGEPISTAEQDGA